jgi:serine/threonine protein kinase
MEVGSGSYGKVTYSSLADKNHVVKCVKKWYNYCEYIDCNCTCHKITCTCESQCTHDSSRHMEDSTIKELVALKIAEASGYTPVLWNESGSGNTWTDDDENCINIGINHAGITLNEFANTISYSERIKFANSLLYQLVWVNQYLYNRGILHLDIKPQNIMIKPSTRKITLIDYGIIAYRHSGSKPFSVRSGTYSYMPIEVFGYHGEIDDRLAVWSIATTIINFVMNRDLLSSHYSNTAIEKQHYQALKKALDDNTSPYAPIYISHLKAAFSKSMYQTLCSMLSVSSVQRPHLTDILGSHVITSIKKRLPVKILKCPDYEVGPCDNIDVAKRCKYILAIHQTLENMCKQHKIMGLIVYMTDMYASYTNDSSAYDVDIIQYYIYIAESLIDQTFDGQSIYDSYEEMVNIINTLRGKLYVQTLDTQTNGELDDVMAVWISKPPPYKGADLLSAYHQIVDGNVSSSVPIYLLKGTCLSTRYINTEKLVDIDADFNGVRLDRKITFADQGISAHSIVILTGK